MEPALKCPQLTNKARVAAMADGAEVLGIKLREKRIANVQVGIMRTQARFENLATVADRFESLARGLAATIVSPQIAKRLFVLEHRRRSNLLLKGTIAGHVGAISAPGQSYFHRAGGKPVRLRP